MISATPIQEKVINKIVNYYFNNKRLVQFIAPTGSGKTFIIANTISQIMFKKQNNEKIIFIIFTLSNAELPIQFENKLLEYQESLNCKYSVKHCSSPSVSNNKVKDNDYLIPSNYDVLIFGTQSFGRNTIYTQLNRFEDLIQEKKNEGYKIIYIRDEAHIGDKVNSKESKREQDLINQEADFIIKMTATPNKSENNAEIVFISEKDLINDESGHYLLKHKQHFNVGFKTNTINDEDILDTAINTFKEIKKKYRKKNDQNKNEYIINPCMLIQISSKNQNGENIDEYDKKINDIVNTLNKNNLSWIIYLANRKESSLREVISKNKNNINLKNISSNNSEIDAVIFKVGPATGWDIPRACMLVQLRRVCSEKLNQQTIGRIKRNPNKNLKYDDLYLQYWVYSDHQEKSREIHKYVLKEKFNDINFPSIYAIDKEKAESDNEYTKFCNDKLNNFFVKNKESIIKIYKNDFTNMKQSVLINQIRYNSNESMSSTYEVRLNNILEIKKYILNVFDKNSWLSKIKLNKIHNQYFKQYMNINQFYFIFCRDYLNDVIKMKNNFFAHSGKYGINYTNKLPKEFIIYDGKNINVDFKDIEDVYGYRYIFLDDNKEHTIQYLDSTPESIYLNYIIDLIKKEKLNNKLDVFVKNPLNSKIFMEYWNKQEAKYCKAYIDFIIKAKNDNTFMFIEVKSKDDYDENKTKCIKEEFMLYRQFIKNSNVNIFLSIVIINKNEKNIIKQIDDKISGISLSISKKENYDFNFNNLVDVFNYIKNK